VLQCDALDHALAAIVVKAPDGEEVRTPSYRRLGHREATWSSSLRELTVTVTPTSPLAIGMISVVAFLKSFAIPCAATTSSGTVVVKQWTTRTGSC